MQHLLTDAACDHFNDFGVDAREDISDVADIFPARTGAS
jgi:hypothetical protein